MLHLLLLLFTHSCKACNDAWFAAGLKWLLLNLLSAAEIIGEALRRPRVLTILFLLWWLNHRGCFHFPWRYKQVILTTAHKPVWSHITNTTMIHHKYASILWLGVDHLRNQLTWGGHGCYKDLAASGSAVLMKLDRKWLLHAVVAWLSLMSESRW